MGGLHPIPVKPNIFHQFGMDLIGPLPETPRGNKYIVTLTDYFSKWAEAAPLPSKHADGVARFIYSVSTCMLQTVVTSTTEYYNNYVLYFLQVICRFGSPETLITDQGREFVNELSAELYSITKTEHRMQLYRYCLFQRGTTGLQQPIVMERFSYMIVYSMGASLQASRNSLTAPDTWLCKDCRRK